MSKKKEKRKILALYALITAIPILIAMILVGIQGLIQKSFTLPMPAWNDEAAYYSLIKTWLSNGQPVGYWGFNGGHAILGTGSGWSSAILFPYAIFGKICSWNYSSIFLANVVFLCIAHALFLYLSKLEKEKLIRVLILQLTSILTMLYITTSMSEPLRYGLVIILAGMFYRLYFMETTKIYKYIILPLYIIAITQVYIFLVFCVPIYIFGILRRKNILKKILYSLASMTLLAGGSYYVLHLISSNYNIYKTERLFDCVKSLDFFGAIIEFIKNFKDGVYSLLSICSRYVGHGLFLWFVPMCIFFIAIPVFLYLNNRKKSEENIKTDVILYAMVLYSVALFLFMYITVYPLERFTFFRSVGIVILFSMYLFVFLDNRKVYLFFAILYGIGILFLPMNMKDFNVERYPGEEIRKEWELFEEELEEVFIIKESEDPWDNTVAVYTLEPRVLASIPKGMGINMMMDASIFAYDAKYILLPVKENTMIRNDWQEIDYRKFLFEFASEIEKYSKVYENKGIQIYRKNTNN